MCIRDSYYGEHLAVNERGRNGGIGSFIFNWCLEHLKGKHVLEVEVPDEEIKRRRINFYKRLGFYYNEYEYIQPPMRKTTAVSYTHLDVYKRQLLKGKQQRRR